MGRVLTHTSFNHEPIEQAPTFTCRRVDVMRRVNVSASTLRRWERDGRLRPYDSHSDPDGHFVVLPGGHKRYCYERIVTAVASP